MELLYLKRLFRCMFLHCSVAIHWGYDFCGHDHDMFFFQHLFDLWSWYVLHGNFSTETFGLKNLLLLNHLLKYKSYCHCFFSSSQQKSPLSCASSPPLKPRCLSLPWKSSSWISWERERVERRMPMGGQSEIKWEEDSSSHPPILTLHPPAPSVGVSVYPVIASLWLPIDKPNKGFKT